jgi:uncharacterized protein (UPF0248 family)
MKLTWLLAMQTIREMLDRIRWDEGFAKGEFAVGYYDRILDREVIVPFRATSLDVGPGRQRTFLFEDGDGVVHRVPVHRIRTVYKDGVVIWQRPALPG